MDCRIATLLAMTEEVVIASAARQSTKSGLLDCHVANAPRNDESERLRSSQ